MLNLVFTPGASIRINTINTSQGNTKLVYFWSETIEMEDKEDPCDVIEG